MSVEVNQVDRLQALLARVQANAAALASARAQGIARAVESTSEQTSASPPAQRSAVQSGPPAPSAPPPAGAAFEEPRVDVAVSIEEDAPAEVLEEDLLVTIPPDAPDGEVQDTGEFEVPGHARAPSLSPEPAFASDAQDVEAPPISTQQHRGEEDMDGLGVSLGFRPSQPADAERDDEEEPPSAPRTPPPESGPQVTIPPKEASDATGAKTAVDEPTMEQLGGTIDLDGAEAPSADLELAEGSAVPSETPDEYEAELPRGAYPATYSDALSSPPSAREELAAHDQAEREREERRSLAPGATKVEASPPDAASPTRADTVVARPPAVVSQPAAIYDKASPGLAPRTFLERLDASLSLGPSSD